MSWLVDPLLHSGIFPRALVAAALAGAVLGALGAFVIVRRMAYIAHGLSHAVIGGAAVSGALAVDPLLGAGVWAFLTALIIDRVERLRGLYADTAIGIVTTASFALGVAVLSVSGRWQRNLEAFLFGGILGVDRTDLLLAGVVAVAVGAALLIRFRTFVFVTFDPEVARTHGVRVAIYEAGLALLLVAGVVAAMRVLGVLLVAAAVVVPPATARLLTDRFEVLVPLGAVLGATGAIPGLYLSWHLDVATGPAIVLVQTALLAAAVGVRRTTGRGSRGWVRAGTAQARVEPPLGAG